ncbi:hypothetical protein AA106555_0716 [Neokomagataea thailandica NBRC 106555]|uniref:Uncharacterized protein n=1 Tax=Neokomagataea thailandica NBRC 106555 TaxID=1223520 RepID=A0ABQ0QNX9_9PROT|nr:hypothetical protein [Neokomagataea thailandica]GBR51873.1 hypothetical protein AA106555_0716 [Neokomagataea thailandica NBRC 106555]
MEKKYSIFIEKIKKEIKETDDKINKLYSEKKFLNDLIEREIFSKRNSSKYIRKNSKVKIIIQSKIVKALSEEKYEKKVNLLYEECSKNENISKSSFRNYISDLEKRDIIIRGSKSGYWKINPTNQKDIYNDY